MKTVSFKEGDWIKRRNPDGELIGFPFKATKIEEMFQDGRFVKVGINTLPKNLQALEYFEQNKRTLTGVNGGDYLDKEDFINYINSLNNDGIGNIVSNESLEDAKKRLNKFSINDKALSQPIYNNGFEMGAAWKEEQLKPLLESHAELLDRLTNCMAYLDSKTDFYLSCITAIEKANKLK